MPEIQMPKLSDTMTEGTLVAWKKKKGDKVSAGEVIAEIETDKATMEWESPEDGTLTEIYVQEGGKVNVGDKIAFIGEEGEAAPKKDEKPKADEKKEKKPQAETEKPAAAKAQEKETAPPQEKKGVAVPASGAKPAEKRPAQPPLQQGEDEARVKASPVARRVAAEIGVDLSNVKGTGPDGRVTESDVRAASKGKGGGAAAAQRANQPTQPRLQKREGESRIQLSGMRKGIAERLVQSLGPVPHFYLTIEINARPLMEAREELKSIVR
jgi:pyruvate dehydrogenase E2 component (dihydrolipoamide acetyltransferase)